MTRQNHHKFVKLLMRLCAAAWLCSGCVVNPVPTPGQPQSSKSADDAVGEQSDYGGGTTAGPSQDAKSSDSYASAASDAASAGAADAAATDGLADDATATAADGGGPTADGHDAGKD